MQVQNMLLMVIANDFLKKLRHTTLRSCKFILDEWTLTSLSPFSLDMANMTGWWTKKKLLTSWSRCCPNHKIWLLTLWLLESLAKYYVYAYILLLVTMLSWSVRTYDPETGEKKVFSNAFHLKHRLLSTLLSIPSDPNKLEYYNYIRLPSLLRHYFPPTKYSDQRLFMEAVRDSDWTLSPTVEQYVSSCWKISQLYFRQHVETIFSTMIDEDFFLFDFVAQNILVQTQSNWLLRPRLIDCKRVWIHLFPRQLTLWLHSQRVAKLQRAKVRLEAFAKGESTPL